MNREKYFVIQQKIIHEFMGEEWFSRQKCRIQNHPAYKTNEIYKKFISQRGEIRWPDDENLMPYYLLSWMEAYDIIKASGTEIDKFDFDSFRLSDFNLYGDEEDQSRIRKIREDPVSFESLLTEFKFYSWSVSNNFDATPYETEGFPDFKLASSKLGLPIVVECKKLMSGSNLNNKVPNIIKGANKQIKKISENCYGIVFIDASSIIENPKTLSDAIPDDVREIINHIERAVSNLNTAVSAVLLSWSDYSVLGDSAKNRMLKFISRRRSILIHHKSPKISLPEGTELQKYGNDLSINIHLEPLPRPFKYIRNGPCNCRSGKRYKHCHGANVI